jgi:hypothetical protein
MIGAGKYDELCTAARESARAKGAILIIMEGGRGSGFSVQGPLEITLRLPGTLRWLADQIETDYEQGL